MRILILSQWFDPEPITKGLLFARALRDLGHDIEVLTGFPNYPGGRVYPGYRIRPWRRQVIDGIPVLRVALYPSHSRQVVGRALNYLSFACGAALGGVMLARGADVAYVYHPPATVGVAALALKYLRGVPFVYDIQDLWPDTLTATGMGNHPIILRTVWHWCHLLYRTAGHIVVLSPGFKRALVARGVPEAKVSVIHNWAQAEAPASIDRDLEHRLAGRFVVLFAGNLGVAQDLDVVLNAAKQLASVHAEVRFVLAGSGVEEARLRQRAADEGLGNVVFLGRLPPERMGSVYARADALLVHLRREPLFAITIPSKTQTYLAAGKPILMGLEGDAAELVRQAGAGLTFEPGNPSDLAGQITSLLAMSEAERDKLGAAGKTFYNEHLSLQHGAKAFEGIFEQVARLRRATAHGLYA